MPPPGTRWPPFVFWPGHPAAISLHEGGDRKKASRARRAGNREGGRGGAAGRAQASGKGKAALRPLLQPHPPSGAPPDGLDPSSKGFCRHLPPIAALSPPERRTPPLPTAIAASAPSRLRPPTSPQHRARAAPPLARRRKGGKRSANWRAGAKEAGKIQPMGARAAAGRGEHEASLGGKGRLSQSERALRWPRPPAPISSQNAAPPPQDPLRAPNPPKAPRDPRSPPSPLRPHSESPNPL